MEGKITRINRGIIMYETKLSYSDGVTEIDVYLST
jgi:hypothetical protein